MNIRTSKRVSYVMATRNRAEHLAAMIENVREFLCEDDELIVVDGGSTDDTPNVIERNRDVVGQFISERDCGEAHALNKGILAANGEYIKFLTDDDYVFADCMAKVISAMEQDPTIDAILCGGEHCYVDADGRTQLDFYFQLTPERAAAVGRPVRETGDSAGPGLGLIIRRRIIPLVGLFDTSFLCVDTEYLTRLKRPEITLRYFDGKLYRHVDYPHSGVTNRRRADADAVRAFLRCARWDEMKGYRPDAVATALGLDRLIGGHHIATILPTMESLRTYGVGRWILRADAAWLAFLSKLIIKVAYRWASQAGWQRRNANRGLPKVEPDWRYEIFSSGPPVLHEP